MNWKRMFGFFERKENLYASLALAFGLMMVVFNPPFAGVPDEHAHYWKAWSFAEGQWKCTGHGDQIPKTAEKLPDAIKPIKYEGVEDKKIVVAFLRAHLQMDETDEKATITGANCPATPFGYIPQIIGLRLGSLLGLSPLADVYLARAMNLIASVFLVYWAIRVAPFGKMVFFLVGLLPLTIQQFASLSYDALQIAASMLFVAYVLKMAVGQGIISRKEQIMLFALSLLQLGPKMAYIPLLLLLFLIPFKRFANRTRYGVFMATTFVVNVGFFLMMRRIFTDVAPPDWIDPALQLRFVLYAPFQFLHTVLDTIYGTGLTKYIAGVLYRPGWGEDVSLYLLLFIFFGFLMFLRNEEETVPLDKKQRIVLFLVAVSNLLLLYLALYLGWSKPGASKISGVQGRYLIPLLPVFIFAFYKSPFRLFSLKTVKEYRTAALTLFITIMFFFVFVTVYGNYYDKTKKGPSVYEEFKEQVKVKQ